MGPVCITEEPDCGSVVIAQRLVHESDTRVRAERHITHLIWPAVMSLPEMDNMHALWHSVCAWLSTGLCARVCVYVSHAAATSDTAQHVIEVI